MSALEIPSRRVLEETPARVFTMLRAIGTVVPIHSALAANGLSDAEVDAGWALVHKVCNYKQPPLTSQIDTRIRDALVEVDAWDEPHLARISATVARLHPDQFDAMMDNLEPATGAAAVVVVERVLDRLDAFEKSPDEQQRAVVATLAARGYDSKERARLRALVKIAKSATTLPPVTGDPDEVHQQDLLALYRWYREWAATARAVLTRRDHLIRLGLANRHSNADDAPAPTPPAPTPAAPAQPLPA